MISLTVFIACLITAHATCPCKPYETVREAFCKSDYVLMARVLSVNSTYGGSSTNTTSAGTWNYNIWHMWTFKGPILATSALSSPNSGPCGVPGALMKNWDYFLTGKKGKNGEITFSNCDFVMPYYEITPEEMHILMELRDEPKKCRGKDDDVTEDESGEKGDKGQHGNKVEENGGIKVDGNDGTSMEEYDENDWEGSSAIEEYDDEEGEESFKIIVEEYDDKGVEEYDEEA
ncbi:hypothetical protein ANCCAN_10665 [Ancylostoma caninum]|uniref:NTR domain-containing protein n=1 Tax=Ancylostoma caninum TaxID=29170 RepID=A0A368GJX9_ANCCA|nr:hypothetical protein ANCCAN_10665 [Ancylostoma caninum]